jgi:hypothetical protein
MAPDSWRPPMGLNRACKGLVEPPVDRREVCISVPLLASSLTHHSTVVLYCGGWPSVLPLFINVGVAARLYNFVQVLSNPIVSVDIIVKGWMECRFQRSPGFSMERTH